jgi:hypothetical protein
MRSRFLPFASTTPSARTPPGYLINKYICGSLSFFGTNKIIETNDVPTATLTFDMELFGDRRVADPERPA